MHVHTLVCMHAHTCACVHVCMCACVRVCMAYFMIVTELLNQAPSLTSKLCSGQLSGCPTANNIDRTCDIPPIATKTKLRGAASRHAKIMYELRLW